MSEPAENHGIVAQLRPLAVEVASLRPDPRNARTHDTRNLDSIRRSLRRYGQRKPLVVRREGMVVEAGNGTLEAAKKLGWTHVAAVVVDDDPTTASGFALADNRTAELAGWDEETLAELLGAQRDAGVELEEVGFTDEELLGLLGSSSGGGGGDPGASTPPAEPVSQRGEIYALGPHRLMCEWGRAAAHGDGPAVRDRRCVRTRLWGRKATRERCVCPRQVRADRGRRRALGWRR